MYQRSLELQKGVNNTVQLQFKNSDQKRIDISTQSFVLNVYDPVDHKLKLTKNVTVLDNASTTTNVLKGLAEVTFTELDIRDIEAKDYKFSVTKAEDDGTYSPAYSNTYYGVAGTLKIKDDVYSVLKPSIAITSFQRNFNTTSFNWEYFTGNIRLSPETIPGPALHTMAFYLNRYKGTVIIEGTLENTPGNYANYFTLATKTYNGKTGPDYVNFNGVFSSVRLKYIPNKDPVTQNNGEPTTSGSLDKVLYRY